MTEDQADKGAEWEPRKIYSKQGKDLKTHTAELQNSP